MALRRLSLAVAVLLFSSAASAQLTFQPNPRKDPYQKLFRDGSPQPIAGSMQDGERLAAPPVVTRQAVLPAPHVVCGMLIVPADPRVDPKIRVGPQDNNVQHTMRTLAPPICRSHEQR